MRKIVRGLAGLVMLGTCSAQAQTIVGESTYEDNYLHTPPPVVAPARPEASRAKAETTPAARPEHPESPR